MQWESNAKHWNEVDNSSTFRNRVTVHDAASCIPSGFSRTLHGVRELKYELQVLSKHYLDIIG